MNANGSKTRSLPTFILLLFGLSIPFWVIGAKYPVQIFPGFNLYQLPLTMPAVAALILFYREGRKDGVVALLKRTYDFRKIKPRIWYLPILLIYPSIAFLDYWILRWSGASIPAPQFSLVTLIGYSTVFLMTFGEELGLTGYAIDPLQHRYSALASGILIGLIQAGYHIPGFIISGYYSFDWVFWHVLYTLMGRILFVWIYNNSGKSMFSMALFHWTFGLYTILWPMSNLQKAPPAYDPRIAALIIISYVVIVTLLWGSKTLTQYRFARSSEARLADNNQPVTANK